MKYLITVLIVVLVEGTTGCTTPQALPRQPLNDEECHLFVRYQGGSIYGDLAPAVRPPDSDLRAWFPGLAQADIINIRSGPPPPVSIGRVEDCDPSFGFSGSEGPPDDLPGGAGYSRPIFGRDGRVALIESWVSGGLLAGSGSICLLRRRDRQDPWQVERCAETWIS
ncbi:hypothetical protein [Brevundimonas sp.]|jgi:hypothetical protein|uniref:hypothetical protein n=1 Tax=Brevundimonas sp. TaxID=1871086 RepID=UPI003782F4FF